MISKTTRRFRQELAKLPRGIRRQAREAYKLFKHNPNYPSLRFKKVHNTEPMYSARLTIGYRAVGILDGEQIVWFWIGLMRTMKSYSINFKLLTRISGQLPLAYAPASFPLPTAAEPDR